MPNPIGSKIILREYFRDDLEPMRKWVRHKDCPEFWVPRMPTACMNNLGFNGKPSVRCGGGRKCLCRDDSINRRFFELFTRNEPGNDE